MVRKYTIAFRRADFLKNLFFCSEEEKSFLTTDWRTISVLAISTRIDAASDLSAR